MMKNERGFTIMELLVVIVIIGVLAAIGVPAYNNMIEKARTTACQANRRTIATAAGMYWAEKGEALTVDDTTAANDLASYLNNITTIKCPSDKGEAGKTGYKVVITDAGLVTVTCNADGTHI